MVPFDVAEEHRAAYHAGAVFASNFLVALAETAADLLTRAGVKDARAALTPLVLRTAANWSERAPPRSPARSPGATRRPCRHSPRWASSPPS